MFSITLGNLCWASEDLTQLIHRHWTSTTICITTYRHSKLRSYTCLMGSHDSHVKFGHW